MIARVLLLAIEHPVFRADAARSGAAVL